MDVEDTQKFFGLLQAFPREIVGNIIVRKVPYRDYWAFIVLSRRHRAYGLLSSLSDLSRKVQLIETYRRGQAEFSPWCIFDRCHP